MVDIGDVASWGGVALSLGAAFIAISNAKSAKRQAQAAESSTGHAERSAKAAEDQAAAAREQVELMRRQINLEEEDREEQGSPQFEVRYWSQRTDGWGGIKGCTLRYVSGPPILKTVQLSMAHDSNIRGFLTDYVKDDWGRVIERDDTKIEDFLVFDNVTRGTGREVFVKFVHGCETSILIGAETDDKTWPPVPVTMKDQRPSTSS